MLREHGFHDGKAHNINARLVSKGEDLILRMRDDCKPFNMADYYQLIEEENDVEKEIGLKIILKMVKDFKYVSTFGANNLILRV